MTPVVVSPAVAAAILDRPKCDCPGSVGDWPDPDCDGYGPPALRWLPLPEALTEECNHVSCGEPRRSQGMEWTCDHWRTDGRRPVPPGTRITLAVPCPADAIGGEWDHSRCGDDGYSEQPCDGSGHRIVGTVTIGKPVPIYRAHTACEKWPQHDHIYVDAPSHTLALSTYADDVWHDHDLSDQLPYGDWTPGHVAYPLTDPERTA